MCFLLNILALLLAFGVKRSSDAETKPAASEEELYQKLLRKSLGDKDQVERLLEHERQRNPKASRVELLRAALERWERDNK
jgi:hypothetical protein